MSNANPNRALLTALVMTLSSMALSGCITAVDEYYAFDMDKPYENPVIPPGIYRSEGLGSLVLTPGSLLPAPAEIVRLRSPLNAYPGPAGESTTDGAVYIPMAIWRPLNYSEKLPIIVDAGPYFEVGRHCKVPNQDPCEEFEDDTIDYPGQRTPWLLRNYLPHGYAIVQLAVRGTGTHGGCMDLMGPAERHDLDYAIRWLGEQDWTNGRIAMIGASYDGSTPWLVASTGNPYLKTIVPVAGLPDIFDLMFRNGSAETRGAVMHGPVYWPYGFDDQFPQQWPRNPPVPLPVPWPNPPPIGQANGREPYQDMQNLLCPEAYEGNAMGQYSVRAGDRGARFSQYWVERDYRDDVLKNYTGSVFLVHGLQDWNVDPHAAIPFNAQLRAKGIHVKEYLGQWGHAFADSVCPKNVPTWIYSACRADFAEILLRWFDKYLKGNMSIQTGPDTQVQNNYGYWRFMDDYPTNPRDADALFLTGGRALIPGKTSPAGTFTMMPPGSTGPATVLEFKSAPVDKDLYISGMPQLHVTVRAQGSGGFLGAWLLEENPEGLVVDRWFWNMQEGEGMPLSRFGVPPIIGHGQIDLRFRDGGETSKPVVPGETMVARLEFEPMEAMILKGNRITLWVFQFQYPDRSSGPMPSPIDLVVGGSASTLRLPLDTVDPFTVFPVPGSHFPQRVDLPRLMVTKPGFAQTILPVDTPSLDPLCRGALLVQGPLQATPCFWETRRAN